MGWIIGGAAMVYILYSVIRANAAINRFFADVDREGKESLKKWDDEGVE